MESTRWATSDRIDLSDRIFHLEVLRGGMNRLLFRSNRSQTRSTRIEVFFMYVQHLCVPTRLEGPVIDRLGPLEENAHRVPWRLPSSETGLSVYSVSARGGSGTIVAAALAVEESSAGPSDPSGFFMMD